MLTKQSKVAKLSYSSFCLCSTSRMGSWM